MDGGCFLALRTEQDEVSVREVRCCTFRREEPIPIFTEATRILCVHGNNEQLQSVALREVRNNPPARVDRELAWRGRRWFGIARVLTEVRPDFADFRECGAGDERLGGSEKFINRGVPLTSGRHRNLPSC